MPMKNPSHPGRLIAGALENLKVTQEQAANAMGISGEQLEGIINGTCGITPDMAVRLEYCIGSTANFWLRVQDAYDLVRARDAIARKDIARLYVPQDLSA